VIESIYIASLLKIPVLSWSVGWILFNCLFAAIGVIIYEGVFEYAPDEDKYDLKSRRGDLFSVAASRSSSLPYHLTSGTF
jgi:hypothetical protein